jgi:hypothetical protein
VLQLVYPAALTGSGQSKKVAGKKRGKAKASKSIAQEHFGKKRRSKRTSATHWDGGDEFPKVRLLTEGGEKAKDKAVLRRDTGVQQTQIQQETQSLVFSSAATG